MWKRCLSDHFFSAKTQPFALTFQSDTYDLATEAVATVPMRGFNIAWFQSSNNC